MSANNNSSSSIDKAQRKKELKDKIYYLWRTVEEIKPPFSSREEAMAAMEGYLKIINVKQLKEFLIDRDCQGKKPELMVHSPYMDPESGITDDRVYLPYNIPEYHQVILDMMKKQQLVPDDSKIDDYDYLFS
jgi:hypothetical protein